MDTLFEHQSPLSHVGQIIYNAVCKPRLWGSLTRYVTLKNCLTYQIIPCHSFNSNFKLSVLRSMVHPDFQGVSYLSAPMKIHSMLTGSTWQSFKYRALIGLIDLYGLCVSGLYSRSSRRGYNPYNTLHLVISNRRFCWFTPREKTLFYWSWVK